jgi:hypothetical protein
MEDFALQFDEVLLHIVGDNATPGELEEQTPLCRAEYTSACRHVLARLAALVKAPPAILTESKAVVAYQKPSDATISRFLFVRRRRDLA